MIFLNVLAWNGERWLRRCLDSLIESVGHFPRAAKILVIDNGSTDGTSSLLRSYGNRIERLRLSSNLGFAGGHNRGIEKAMSDGAEWIALLNQDIWLAPDWLAPLFAAASRDPRIGVLSPFQYDYDGKELDPGFKSILAVIPEASAGLAAGRWDAPYYLSVSATGAAIAVHRGIFERVGLFDPSFFAYHEEVDLYNRLEAVGAKIAVVPASKVYHWHGHIRARLPLSLRWTITRNWYRLLLKDVRAPMRANAVNACVSWLRNIYRSLTEGRPLSAGLHFAVVIFDLPWRLPAIARRRRLEKTKLAGAKPFRNSPPVGAAS